MTGLERHLMGCGTLAGGAVALTVITWIADVRLINRALISCVGDLSGGESFAMFGLAILRAGDFAAICSTACLVAWAVHWLCRPHVGDPLLWTLLALVVLAGPATLIVQGVAEHGIVDGCAAPSWWPSWFPT
ncbi:hypothetical protein ACIBH1_20150 [Nonomuraea sp. NPDC050663]|uniref:hypothetical protein n=1 Tax=Nonomuraea sp. NPDC050663 TaxID=3364370 RepID=UPI003799F2DC